MNRPFINITREGEPGKKYACPCCEFKTLPARGHYDICSVCFWEDDGQDDHDSDEIRGGPNGELSLVQARFNFRNYGACDKRFVDNVRPPPEEER
jgi:hypothetical protein